MTSCEKASNNPSDMVALGDCNWENHNVQGAEDAYSQTSGVTYLAKMGEVKLKTGDYKEGRRMLLLSEQWETLCAYEYNNGYKREAADDCIQMGPNDRAVFANVDSGQCDRAIDLVKNYGYCADESYCRDYAYACKAYDRPLLPYATDKVDWPRIIVMILVLFVIIGLPTVVILGTWDVKRKQRRDKK